MPPPLTHLPLGDPRPSPDLLLTSYKNAPPPAPRRLFRKEGWVPDGRSRHVREDRAARMDHGRRRRAHEEEETRQRQEHGCQMAIARFLHCMYLSLRASGLWLRYATLQNLIPSFPWIAPPRPPPWRNPRKGRDPILPSGNHDQERHGRRRRILHVRRQERAGQHVRDRHDLHRGGGRQ